MKEYTIVFSQEAIVSFHAIKEQIDERFGQKEMQKFEKRILKTLNLISKFPQSFEFITNSSSVHKGFVHKNCSLFYQVKESSIEVLFFWDNRQEPLF